MFASMDYIKSMQFLWFQQMSTKETIVTFYFFNLTVGFTFKK